MAKQVWHQHPSPLRQEWSHEAEVERRPAEAVKAHHQLVGVRFTVLGEVDATVDVYRAGSTTGRPPLARHYRLTKSSDGEGHAPANVTDLQPSQQSRVVIGFSFGDVSMQWRTG
jgi:hypothetical protein